MSMMKHTTDQATVKGKMKATFKHRQELLHDPDQSTLILDNFPCFLDTPGLIDQDFTMLFGENVSGKFVSKWPTFYKPRIITICKGLRPGPHLDDLLSAQEASNDYGWDSDLAAILLLLHLLPPTAKGKVNGKISAANAADHVVKFMKVGTSMVTYLQDVASTQPFLLCVGEKMSKIQKYYIILDQKALPCMAQTAVAAFDELFKAHFVFAVAYDKALFNFYTFLQTTVYGIDVSTAKESPRDYSQRKFSGWKDHSNEKMLTTSMFGLHRLRGKVNESSLSTSANTNHHPTSSSASASGDSLSSVQYCNGCTCASHRDCSCSSGAISGADRPSEAASHVSLERSPPPALTSAFRWSLEYDLCVCHSAKDDQEAECLVSYLEATVRSLRCFLPPRDSSLGSPMSTELHRAVQSSHCWVLLITSHFLQDDWCLYLMHQALSEAPMSNRIIPTVLHLPYSECPKELRFYYIIDLSQKANQHHGYDRVYKAVLNYLEDSLGKDTNKAIASTATISDAEIDDFSSLKEMDANMYHTSTKVKQRPVAKLPNACNVM